MSEKEALVPADEVVVDMVAVIERLATNKDVDVEKFERLIALQERVMARQAEAAFNAAFSDMQAEIPTVAERGIGDKGMTYARLEDIIKVVRPILQKFGFSLSHRTEWPDTKTIKVIGVLTHRAGHARQSEFLSAADNTGSKNAIQALGSANHYGRRYTTKDLLNIATSGEDDDGRASEQASQGDAPEGFDDWLADMESCADTGTKALMQAWNKSSKVHQKHLGMRRWETLKKRAASV